MNERIKELRYEAGILAYEEHETNCIKNGRDPSMPHANALDMTFQKFAELIVRECVKEIEFQYGGGSDHPMDNEWDRAIECVSSMVKYRFGVE